MTKQQFEDWILKYSPDDDYDDLLERLAMGSIGLIEKCSIDMKVPIPELLKRFYYGGIDS